MAEYAGIIYVCRNLTNSKIYVGQTKCALKTRMNGHMCRSRKGSDHAFHEALKKYGRESFEVRVVAVCKSRDEMHLAERFWINKLNSIAPNGYNLTDGGEGALPSEETRAKMRESSKKRVFTEEWRMNLSLANKGRKHSPESIKKVADAQRGKKRPNTSEKLKGHKHSEETKRKLSEATKRSMTPERKVAIAATQREVSRKRRERVASA